CAWAAAITMALANVGKKKPSKEEKTERSAGERVLRYLAGQGFREELLKDAKGIGEEAAVMALLDVDPLTLPKAKIPKLPAFADAASLPALERIAGGTLSAEEVEHILVRLAVSNVDEVHPAVLALRSTLTPESMKTFSWALFEAWLSNKAPSKQGWAMQALGFMGDDETARNICRLAKDWPGQNASARAQAALDVLLAIGSEVALVNMNLLAEKSKYPAFKAAAAERIGLIAQKRGLTRAALQDRLVPTLSLEEEGGAKLDFGPRHFVVSFDEQLRPVLHDDSGKKLKRLPKPNKPDGSALAKAAKARFSGLKKDAKASASVQLSRLEFAMIEQRTIEGDVFEEHFVNHPWMSNLTKRLVWCAVDKKGDITASFRVGEDGSFADSNDDAYSLKAKGVRIAHPLQIQGDIDKWSSIFADYEILQPFDQLGRMTFAPSATEKKADTLERVVGKNVRYGALRALTKGRWRAWADSWITTYSMELIGGGSVSLGFEPGYSPAGDEFEDQTIESVNLSGVDSFAAVEPIAFSELVRELEHIT
ncbi:MAG: DUF4132 domain-containing protein, partial [Polyangiales bacterium]